MRPLAIIECDGILAANLHATLESAGFHAHLYATASAALPHLCANEYALAILALDMKDADAYAICSEASRHLPVITLTSACDEEVCVRALQCGADDCVQRRVSTREIVARVRSVLRRTGTQELASFAAFDISLSEMRVRVNGVTHNLSLGETELLTLLVESGQTPVTVNRLASALGAKRGTVESRIQSLRRKLGPGHLVSRGGLGYHLSGS